MRASYSSSINIKKPISFERSGSIKQNDYYNVYGRKYLDSINMLEDLLIREETGHRSYKVFPLEAGLGKSRESVRILKEYYKHGGTKKVLIVKAFERNNEIDEVVNSLNSIEQGLAIGITHRNWEEWRSRPWGLRRFKVIVITHQRYIDLCLSPRTRKGFSDGRHTLIIDEKINFPVYYFDNELYKYIQGKLTRYELDAHFEEVCNPLLYRINALKHLHGSNTRCIICKPEINEDVLSSFVEVLSNNYRYINDNHEVMDFVKTLKVLYQNECVYNYERISAVHPQHRLWGLSNNIILDANGTVEPLYLLDNRIEVVDISKIICHSHSQVNRIDYNSSMSKIRSTPDFVSGIVALIIQHIKELPVSEKILLVSHKAFEQKLTNELLQHQIEVGVGQNYTNEKVAINHFGNLIGSNQYIDGDFSQCWILGTPNLRKEYYLHKHKHYSKDSLLGRDLSFGGNRTQRFNDAELETIRCQDLIGQTYQALKRIQRNPAPKAEYFIVTNNEDVYNGVVQQMEGIREGRTIELELESSIRRPTWAEKFHDYVIQLPPGEYLKRDILNTIGFPVRNFNRLRIDLIVKRMEDAGVITFPPNNRRIIKN